MMTTFEETVSSVHLQPLNNPPSLLSKNPCLICLSSMFKPELLLRLLLLLILALVLLLLLLRLLLRLTEFLLTLMFLRTLRSCNPISGVGTKPSRKKSLADELLLRPLTVPCRVVAEILIWGLGLGHVRKLFWTLIGLEFCLNVLLELVLLVEL